MGGIPAIRRKRLERTALLLGAGAVMAGASVLSSPQAQYTFVCILADGSTYSAVVPVTTPATTITLTATVTPSDAAGPAIPGEPLVVDVPPTGSFTLTAGTGAVNLTGAAHTGALSPVTVSDTRNTYPGWSVSGQDSNWAGSGTAAGGTISGNQLGWTPTSTTLATGVTLGSALPPASPGLGTTAAVLASSPAGSPNGFGTSTFGANLTLAIPAGTIAGPYTSLLTITAVTSAT